MLIRQQEGRLLVWPEGREYRAFKLWMMEYGNDADDYRDSTAGCYVIRSHGADELKEFGFKTTMLDTRRYNKIIRKALARGCPEEEEEEVD
jgi:hypothetical protein